jgi:hypothetical protein
MSIDRIEELETEIAKLRKLREGATTVLRAPPVQLQYVLVPVFCLLTGYSEKAVRRRKIGDGVWIEGRHHRKAPDGRITMDLQAYCRWVES